MKLAQLIFILLLFGFSLHAEEQSSNGSSSTNDEYLSKALEASKLCIDFVDRVQDDAKQKCEYAITLSKEANLDSLTVTNLNKLA